MQFIKLAAIFAAATTGVASPAGRDRGGHAPTASHPPAPGPSFSNHTAHVPTTKRYAILDNDWSSTGFIPFLMGLDAGINILALTSCKRSNPPWHVFLLILSFSNCQLVAKAMCIPRLSHSSTRRPGLHSCHLRRNSSTD
jgi:hypothetical protein